VPDGAAEDVCPHGTRTHAPTRTCAQVVARPLQLEERMAVLAAAISIDYNYFS